MKSEKIRRANGKNEGPSKRGERAQFSFGARRYSVRAAKRLFVTQESFISSTFAEEPERTGTILRAISAAA
jgi:hypothetical protein